MTDAAEVRDDKVWVTLLVVRASDAEVKAASVRDVMSNLRSFLSFSDTEQSGNKLDGVFFL